MNNETEKDDDDEQSSTGDEISQDALGDTHLGKNLGHLIREIGRQQKRIQEKAAAKVAGGETQDSDTADRMERLDEALNVVAANKENSGPALAFVNHGRKDEAATSSTVSGAGVRGGSSRSDAGDAFSNALSEIESTLRQFAEAERNRYEKELDDWKAKFKKAAVIAIKKQVEAARANWARKTSENEAKVAEHYKKLKVLADKVAKQKVEIQNAKQELREKLELADRLHVEFDGIRQVLDGKLGVLDQLDKEDEES
ncbi:MAG TPA: hypothetical protein VLS27_03430 [Gammaproteobacteria bacterium]|nr:hypothetical protein [Gammaproteobacteria bacterium]